MGKKTFKIPVEWSVFSRIEVEADSLEEALKYVQEDPDNLPLPTDTDYIDGTFKVSGEDEYDGEELVEYLKEYYDCNE